MDPTTKEYMDRRMGFAKLVLGKPVDPLPGVSEAEIQKCHKWINWWILRNLDCPLAYIAEYTNTGGHSTVLYALDAMSEYSTNVTPALKRPLKTLLDNMQLAQAAVSQYMTLERASKLPFSGSVEPVSAVRWLRGTWDQISKLGPGDQIWLIDTRSGQPFEAKIVDFDHFSELFLVHSSEHGLIKNIRRTSFGLSKEALLEVYGALLARKEPKNAGN